MPPHLRRSPRQHTVPEVVSLPCGILLRGSPVSAFGWCSHSDGVIPMAFPFHIPPTNSLAHPQPSPGYYVMGGAPDRLRFGVVRVVRQQCVLVVCEAHGCSAGYVLYVLLLCCVVCVYMCCVVVCKLCVHTLACIITTTRTYIHTITHAYNTYTQCCGCVPLSSSQPCHVVSPPRSRLKQIASCVSPTQKTDTGAPGVVPGVVSLCGLSVCCSVWLVTLPPVTHTHKPSRGEACAVDASMWSGCCTPLLVVHVSAVTVSLLVPVRLSYMTCRCT